MSVAANQTYTEADVRELRREWERERQQSDLVKQMATLEGRLAAIPDQMETVARRVVAEVLAEQRARSTERNWSRAPVVAQMLQLVLALSLAFAGYMVGSHGIPP